MNKLKQNYLSVKEKITKTRIEVPSQQSRDAFLIPTETQPQTIQCTNFYLEYGTKL